MKRLLVIVMLLISARGYSQAEEIEQLLLDLEKLTQFKAILQDMKEGYDLLEKGYSAIRDISQGNFNLHKSFLDGLLAVSPAVSKYARIAEIISYETKILSEYKSIVKNVNSERAFSAKEIEYVLRTSRNLLSSSIKTLDELAMIITAGSLRMSDDERIKGVDRVYNSIFDQYSFLRQFNSSTSLLAIQRKSGQAEIDYSKRLNEK